MDQCTRRIIGFGIQRGIVDGAALCRMFHQAVRGNSPPKYLSSDHDPRYRYHQWQANLRVLDILEIKTVPYIPLSHGPEQSPIQNTLGTRGEGAIVANWTKHSSQAWLPPVATTLRRFISNAHGCLMSTNQPPACLVRNHHRDPTPNPIDSFLR
jgi:hypothetical protein